MNSLSTRPGTPTAIIHLILPFIVHLSFFVPYTLKFKDKRESPRIYPFLKKTIGHGAGAESYCFFRNGQIRGPSPIVFFRKAQIRGPSPIVFFRNGQIRGPSPIVFSGIDRYEDRVPLFQEWTDTRGRVQLFFQEWGDTRAESHCFFRNGQIQGPSPIFFRN